MVKKNTNPFFTKKNKNQKKPKVQTPSGIPVCGTVGVLWGVLQEYICCTVGVLWGVLQEYIFLYCGGTAGEYCRSTFFWGGAVGLLLGRTAGVPLFGTVGVLWGVLQEYNFWYWFCVMASLLLVLLFCTGPSTGLVLILCTGPSIGLVLICLICCTGPFIGLVLFCVLDHSTTLKNQHILL